jgi:hypothetical protein
MGEVESIPLHQEIVFHPEHQCRNGTERLPDGLMRMLLPRVFLFGWPLFSTLRHMSRLTEQEVFPNSDFKPGSVQQL